MNGLATRMRDERDTGERRVEWIKCPPPESEPEPRCVHGDFPWNMVNTVRMCGQCWCTWLWDQTQWDACDMCAAWCVCGLCVGVCEDVREQNHVKPVEQAWAGTTVPTCCVIGSGRRPADPAHILEATSALRPSDA